MAVQVQDLMPPDSAQVPNTWDAPTPGAVSPAVSKDPALALALKGYQHGVQTGQVDPVDGLNRLKKIGAVAPHVKVEDLLPGVNQAKASPAPIPGNMNGPDGTDSANPPVSGPVQFPQHAPNGALDALISGAGMPPMKKTSNSNAQANVWDQNSKNVNSAENTNSNSEVEADSKSNGVKNVISSGGKFFDPHDYALEMAQSQGFPINDAGSDPSDPRKKLYSIGGTPDPNSPFQQQKMGIQRIQDLMKMENDAVNQNPVSMTNLSPMASYVDALNAERGVHTDLAKGYTAPQTPEQMKAQFLGAQQKIMDDRAQLQKSLYENLRTARPTLNYQDMFQNTMMDKSGLTSKTADTSKDVNSMQVGTDQKQTDSQKADSSVTTGNPAMIMGVAKIGQSQERMNQTSALRTQQMVAKDPILNQYQQRVDGANKILNLMNAADGGDVASTQAMLGQLNNEIGRLETGSQSPGLGMTEKTEMESFAARMSAIRDKFTGTQTPVDLHNTFTQARAIVGDLRNSITQSMSARMSSLKAGSLPNQQSVFNGKEAEMTSSNANVPQPITKVGKDGKVYKKNAADGLWYPTGGQ